jgi:hypothetical protein
MRDFELLAHPVVTRPRKIAAALVGLTLAASALFTGCGHTKATVGEGLPADAPQEGIAITDPDVEANLRAMTMDLHQSLIHHSKGFSSFDEFVAFAQEKPPTPPPGTKYAISKACQIVLVKANP